MAVDGRTPRDGPDHPAADSLTPPAAPDEADAGPGGPGTARTVLEVSGLRAGYGRGGDILHGVNLVVRSREVVTVLGPNGAGKSTVLKAIMGQLSVRAGSIRLQGDELAGVTPGDVVRRGVGYVPQLRNVFPTLTVQENLEMGFFAAEPGLDRQAALQDVYQIYPALRDKAGERVRSLSGGQRQMVAMGRALVAKPKLLLLDEPSAGLAPNLVDAVFAAVLAIARAGVPTLLVEQNAGRALRVADRGYVLDQGRNAFEGPAQRLVSDPEVMRLYLGGSRSGPESGPDAAPADTTESAGPERQKA